MTFEKPNAKTVNSATGNGKSFDDGRFMKSVSKASRIVNDLQPVPCASFMRLF